MALKIQTTIKIGKINRRWYVNGQPGSLAIFFGFLLSIADCFIGLLFSVRLFFTGRWPLPGS